ncbi:MAG: hypothetical protein R2793_09945 [Flavobacteriaceae bacterium]
MLYKRDINQLLADIYKSKGDYKNALISHQEYKLLSDSIFNKESIEKITQIEYEYKYKQAIDSANIRELKLTKTVLSTAKDLEKTQRNYLWAIIGVLLISIISRPLFSIKNSTMPKPLRKMPSWSKSYCVPK